MAFPGTTFVFDGIPSEQFDLMMYEINGETHDETEFASGVSIIDEVVGSRWRPYFYGVQYDSKLEFEVTFGLVPDRLDEARFLDKAEIAEIAAWLTGHTEYKYLEIDQEDMDDVRYRCMITALSLVKYGDNPYAFRATVSCDSAYAYMRPREYRFAVNGSVEAEIFNPSAIHGYYYPAVTYTPRDNVMSDYDFTMQTAGEPDRIFSMQGVPASIRKVDIDNDLCVITNDQQLNIYPMCNYNFFRLKRGSNRIVLTGNGVYTIRCEFPVNIGS